MKSEMAEERNEDSNDTSGVVRKILNYFVITVERQMSVLSPSAAMATSRQNTKMEKIT